MRFPASRSCSRARRRSVSREWSPIAAAAGAVVVDNSSAFRMDPDVPLVVPEVNPHDIPKHHGIIANPNCSTIQMVVALKPLHDAARVRRVVVSTYQSVSGAGQKGIHELEAQTEAHVTKAQPPAPSKFAHPIFGNCIPQIDDFLPSGYTKEEMKMVNETRKIMGDATIDVSPTCVRVPVAMSHSESILVETERPITVEEARSLWASAPGRDGRRRSAGPGLSPRRRRRRQGRRLRRPHPPGPAPAQHAALLVRQRQPPQGRGHQRRADRREIARALTRWRLTRHASGGQRFYRMRMRTTLPPSPAHFEAASSCGAPIGERVGARLD